jgi:hypothetical protein
MITKTSMPQLELDPGFAKPVSASDIAEPGYVSGGTALPAASTNLLKNGNIACIKPNGRLAFWFTSTVAGTLTVTYTVNGVITKSLQNLGASLTANAEYSGQIAVDANETVNFQYSVTSGTYRLVVREI